MAILTFLIILIVSGIFGVWAFFYIMKKRFNKIIIIWGKVGGHPKIIGRDRAMEKKVGTGEDSVFYLQKLKKILPTPNIQTGDNTYWFAKRTQDGELINIGMEDFDLIFCEARVNYTDKETRYARASLQKLNKDRFNEEGFWKKYGNTIMSIIFIVIVSIMLLLIASKLVDIMGRADTIMKASAEVIAQADKTMGALDNVCRNNGIIKQ